MHLASPNHDVPSSFMTFLQSPIQLLTTNWVLLALLLAAFFICSVTVVICSVTVFLRRRKQSQEYPPLLAPPVESSSSHQASLNGLYTTSMYHRPYPQQAQGDLIVKISHKQDARVKQPYDAFLVLDVEATCQEGAGFEWPNEIIEWPVCLMRWKDKSSQGKACQLEIVDEFRSFVKPTWRPQLSQFCTDLTGITQAQVNSAPNFQKVLKKFARFLAYHGLIDPKSGRPIQRFCWCSDGPFDVRDFVVKQCFISKAPMPPWLKGDVLDVRRVVSVWAVASGNPETMAKFAARSHIRSLNIPQQLQALGLPAFQGRLHSGIDDTRNIARVMTELARRGVRLEPNTSINPNRRWNWMGRPGEVLEYTLVF